MSGDGPHGCPLLIDRTILTCGTITSRGIVKLAHPGTQAVLVYRFGHWVLHFNVPVVRTLLVMVYQVLQYFVRILIGVNIPVSAEIGGGFIIHTWSGVFVPCCRIGRNVLFQHGVNVHWDCKGIGDDVYFGPGCKVIRHGHTILDQLSGKRVPLTTRYS